MTPEPMSTATTDRKAPFLSRAGRWVAELVLVFVGVYAAFWLNSYQQRQQEAKRHDQILASLEETLKEGVDNTKTEGAKEDRELAKFQRALQAGEMPQLLSGVGNHRLPIAGLQFLAAEDFRLKQSFRTR